MVTEDYNLRRIFTFFGQSKKLKGVSPVARLWKYLKIPKISPSKHEPPKLTINRRSKYKTPRGLYLEIALKYKVKQSKNGKFTSNYKASPIDFETQISLRR